MFNLLQTKLDNNKKTLIGDITLDQSNTCSSDILPTKKVYSSGFNFQHFLNSKEQCLFNLLSTRLGNNQQTGIGAKTLDQSSTCSSDIMPTKKVYSGGFNC
jgi:hypothetical protein